VSGAAARTISKLGVKLPDGLKRMIDRRKVFTLLGAAGQEPPVSPNDALARLKEGNRRFVSGQSQHSHESATLRHQFVSGQHPFAIVLGCSDSRVPVELIFDQGFGDRFVIRVAGNVITDDVLGSIEYARIHLNSQLLVILGHEGCGAVTAALEARKHASSDPHGIQTIVKQIDPAIGNIDPGLPASEQVHWAVESAAVLNAAWTVYCLQKEFHEEFPELGVVYGAYGLFTRRVRLPLSPAIEVTDDEKGLFEPPEDVEGFRQLTLRICSGKLEKGLLGIPQ
jgi:carbonic anhydrase